MTQRVEYKVREFCTYDLTPLFKDKPHDGPGEYFSVWLDEMAARGFIYKTALSTGHGFAIVVEREVEDE